MLIVLTSVCNQMFVMIAENDRENYSEGWSIEVI